MSSEILMAILAVAALIPMGAMTRDPPIAGRVRRLCPPRSLFHVDAVCIPKVVSAA